MADLPETSGSLRRNAALIVVIVLAVTLVGFLRGIKEPDPIPHGNEDRRDETGRSDGAHEAVPQAVRYAALHKGSLQPSVTRSNLTGLTFDKPDPFAKIVRTDEMKMQALEDRGRWRAFDGAPPAIPHPVDFMQATNCVACHGSGLRIGDKLATKMSHPYFTNCTQCHVESVRPEFASLASPLSDNTFIGFARSGPGERAWPGAPPTIPHTTWMRQDCASCHGLIARPGIRTTHPWLTNCTQCHGPSAALDQVAFPFDAPGGLR